jgi:CRISPR locus-related DNA-binding protein
MKIMIATFGVESRGITEAITMFGCQKLIVLLSEKPQDKKSPGEFKKIEKMAKYMNIPMEKIIISPYAVMENIQRIKEIVESHEGNEIILNVSGGRKTMSLAATLAGFVSNPKKIIYIPADNNNQPIEIPRFTIKKKVVSKSKLELLRAIEENTTYEEIKKFVSKNYDNILKHLRELEAKDLIEISKKNPHTYTITPSGKLLR